MPRADATLRALLPVRRLAAVLEPDERLTYLSDGAGWAETDDWHTVPMSTPGAAFGGVTTTRTPPSRAWSGRRG